MEGEEVSPPLEWTISRVCEEFHCLPSEAAREIMEDPAQMAFDIMELRAYARAKEALDNAKNSKDVPKGVLVDRVWEIEHELLKRRKEGK